MAQRTPAKAAVRLVVLSAPACEARFRMGSASSQWPLCASLMARWALSGAALDPWPGAEARRASGKMKCGSLSIKKEADVEEHLPPIISARSVIKLEGELDDTRTFRRVAEPHITA